MTAFKPTLAVAADLQSLSYPKLASPKLDGIRCSIVNGRALTRTLKSIPNKHISNLLSNLDFEGLDGELIVGHPTSTSVYRDTNSAVMSHEGTPEFTYYVFDKHDAPGIYTERHKALQIALIDLPDCIRVLEQTKVTCEGDLIKYEQRVVAAGYEGVILRDPDSPYKFGRSTSKEQYLLKVKRFTDAEAEVVGFEEEMFNGNVAQVNELGRTKRSTCASGLTGKGTLGAFCVRDLVTGVEFNIGTGLTAHQRKDFWERQQTLVGRLVKYKHFEVGAKIAPRHPVFLGFREVSDL